MINVTISFSLSDLPFYFIPKFFNINKNKFKGFVIRWLTFQLIVNNSKMSIRELECCYQAGYTVLFDSFAKSTELVNLINENESIVDTLPAVVDFVSDNNPFEKDTDGEPHIICDIPGQNIWQENQLRNQILREVYHKEVK